MAGKKTGKRLLTWVLVLVMALSLLPLNALAEEVSGEGTDVVYGYDTGNGWVRDEDNNGTDPITNVDGVDSVSKTAEPTGTPNEYRVTLEVVLKETTTNVPSQAATVLVIDTSGSMACEKNEHTHSDTCYAGKWVDCTRENHSSHWHEETDLLGYKHWRHTNEDVGCKDNGGFFSSKWQYYVKDNPEVLICDKEEHIHSSACDCRINAAKAAARNFLDSYRLNATAGRYVALVDFNTTANVAAGWQDVSTDAGYNAILAAINSLSANGGTNLEQGLVNAQTLLSDPTVSSIAAKHVIALTDVEPTLYGKDGEDGGRNYCDVDTFDATNTAATNLKAVARLHTISFGTSTEKMLKKPAYFVWESNEYWEYTVSEYLAACVASPESAYSAGNAADLNRVFAAISENITSGLSSGTVHDSLPTGVTSSAIPNGTADWDWDLKDFEKDEEKVGDTTTYTYTKHYTVTIDPTQIPEIEDGDYYPLNGPTTLTVKDSNGQDVTIDFPIPAGKVTLPKYTVTYKVDGQQVGEVETYKFGDPVTIREKYVKEGYEVSDWSITENFTMPAENVVIAATSTANTYTVTWKNYDGTVLEEDKNVPYGTTPEYNSATPTRPASGRYTYTFKSWDKDLAPVTGDVIYTATYTETYHRPSTPSKPTLNTGDHYAYVMGYPDGTVRPNGSITRAEVSTILFRLLSDKTRDEYFTTESSFTDVKAGAWYNNSIATLEKAGVIVDTAKGGAFRPNEAITRAELAAMLAQFSDAKPVKGVKFSDVSAEHWAYEAIAIAAKMGWIEGYPDGTFRPDATITRAEMMTLVNRALERVPSDEDHLLSKRVMLTFPDCKSGDWFYIAVQEATNSHTYERAATEKNGDEQWTALRANRDWTQLEK